MFSTLHKRPCVETLQIYKYYCICIIKRCTASSAGTIYNIHTVYIKFMYCVNNDTIYKVITINAPMQARYGAGALWLLNGPVYTPTPKISPCAQCAAHCTLVQVHKIKTHNFYEIKVDF